MIFEISWLEGVEDGKRRSNWNAGESHGNRLEELWRQIVEREHIEEKVDALPKRVEDQ